MLHFLLKAIHDNADLATGDTYLRFQSRTVPGPAFLYLEWAITILAFALCLILPRAPLRPITRRVYAWMTRFASNHWRACLAIFCISVAGRIALLSIERFPEPAVHDEFSYLLGADTLAHGRLANPELPSWHHFEPFHVLMEPTYATMYPPGFPIFLALGEKLFDSPRAGVVICAAAAAASLCWMLQILVPPGWAFAAGLLAAVRINWFSYFGTGYWGGAAAILGGCLLAGSAIRLVRRREPRVRNGILLGIALFLLMNTRPFEGGVFAAPLVAWMLWKLFQGRSLKTLVPGCVIFLAGVAWTGFYCYKVTGRLMAPQALQREQWAMMPIIVGVKPHYGHTYQFADQIGLYRDYELNYMSAPQSSVQGYLEHLPAKLFNVWDFYLAPSLTFLLIGFVPVLRSRKYRLLLVATACLWAAVLLEYFMQAHYFAPAAGVLYLLFIQAFRWLRTAGRRHAVAGKLLNGAVLAIAVTLVARLLVVPVESWPPSWCSFQHEMPGYGAILRYTEKLPGRQLIFLHYDAGHRWPDSWINNGADVASQKVIWARDTEPLESNAPLVCAYPGRQVFLLTPPDYGYTRPPDPGSTVNIPIEQFLKPYPGATEPTCAATGDRRAAD